MKRKIIKQGNSGLTMSLPIGWARELNLEAGHEIDVKLIGKDLVVSANKQKTFESIRIFWNARQARGLARTVLQGEATKQDVEYLNWYLRDMAEAA